MRFLFFIQAEGRGHQTQALSLYAILQDAGHEVVAAIVGTTGGRSTPALLREQLNVPMIEVPSPALIYSRTTKSLDLGRTLRVGISNMSRYWRTAHRVHETVQRYQPDVLVNFYEMTCGIYHWLYQPAIPTVSIAHQYLMLHPDFQLPATRFLHRKAVNQVTRLTAIGTTRQLALSFYSFPDSEKDRIFPVPPLLRAEVLTLKPENESFFLAYMTHHRLADDLIDWSNAHPDVQIQAFWDKPDAPESWQATPSLVFYPINATRFLEAMRRCKGLVSTAGFESVCEAMYLDKPVMMLPVPGHYEQACNAIDAERAGAGFRATSFSELTHFLDYLPTHRPIGEEFRAWQAQTASRFLYHLTTVESDKSTRLSWLGRTTGRWLRSHFAQSKPFEK